MSLLTYYELCRLVEKGVIAPVEKEQINAASIDVRLGDTILVENTTNTPDDDDDDDAVWQHPVPTVDLQARESPEMLKINLRERGSYTLEPGEFILASTLESFHLPEDLAAEFRLKSSLARAGLNQSLAVWCDPGWTGSVLTLELHNLLSYHTLLLTPGMRIGQMVFFRGKTVPPLFSYALRGSYNHDEEVTKAKEVVYETYVSG